MELQPGMKVKMEGDFHKNYNVVSYNSEMMRCYNKQMTVKMMNTSDTLFWVYENIWIWPVSDISYVIDERIDISIDMEEFKI